jgi:hypothetical protein
VIMNYEAVTTHDSAGNVGDGRVALTRSHGDNLALLTVVDGATGESASVLLGYSALVRLMAQAGSHLASGKM